MADETEEAQGDVGGPAKTKGVKTVNKDQSAEDERTHFRRQLVRRPWSH